MWLRMHVEKLTLVRPDTLSTFGKPFFFAPGELYPDPKLHPRPYTLNRKYEIFNPT